MQPPISLHGPWLRCAFQAAQAMGVGLKYSDNNRLWLTVPLLAAQYSVPSRVSVLALWTTVLKISEG